MSQPPYDSLNLGAGVGDDPGAVMSNRRRLAEALDLAPERVVYMHQVHGDRVLVVEGVVDGPPPEADGLVTSTRGLGLAVLVADCVPVLLADAEAGVIAAVHAGRRGVAAGILARVLAAMTDLGADLRRVEARLGPAVCGACYEVPEQMQRDFLARVPGARATTRSGTPALDLRAGLTAQLEAVAVRAASVGPCTVESPEQYSYRREGVTGRTAGLVWLPA